MEFSVRGGVGGGGSSKYGRGLDILWNNTVVQLTEH